MPFSASCERGSPSPSTRSWWTPRTSALRISIGRSDFARSRCGPSGCFCLRPRPLQGWKDSDGRIPAEPCTERIPGAKIASLQRPTGRPSRGGEVDGQDHADSQREEPRRRRGAADAARGAAARAPAAHRHPRGLRHQPVRRLYGVGRRQVGQEPHDAGGGSRRRGGDHHRGAGAERRSAPHAGGFQRLSRPAVRFLHARHGDERHRAGGAQSAARRGRGAALARRQPLPLHRLSQHRPGRASGGGDDARRCSMSAQGFGASVARREDRRFLLGKGRYTDDIVLPAQSWAVFVRSPHAHAAIRSVDASRALAAPGVLAVLTGDDVAADGLGGIPCGWQITNKDGSVMVEPPHPALAQGKVRHAGDPVAMVIAETKAQAKDAAALVDVDYEPLPAVAHLRAAVADGAPQVWDEAAGNVCFDWHIGDAAATDAAFAGADRVVSIDLVNNRVAPNAIEPRAANGHYDLAEDRYTLYTTSQNPHLTRLLL